MRLLPFDTVKELSGYASRRSVARWLSREFDMQLIKIGKHYYVDRDLFEKKIEQLHKLKKRDTGYRAQSKDEESFQEELRDYLLEL